MMFIWETLSNWWDILWQSLGLAGKEGSVVLLGLDNAGKTTLLHRLRTGKIQQHTFPPTDRPSAAANTFQYQGVTLAAWDLGGHEVVRHLWADYVAAERARPKQKLAIIFLVDAADVDRIEEAGYELDNLIHESLLKEEDDDGNHGGRNPPPYSSNGNGATPASLSNTSTASSSSLPPVAIFLNKCDLTTAASTEEICQRMDWSSVETAYPPDKIHIFRGSVWKEEGYPDVFRWIATFF